MKLTEGPAVDAIDQHTGKFTELYGADRLQTSHGPGGTCHRPLGLVEITTAQRAALAVGL